MPTQVGASSSTSVHFSIGMNRCSSTIQHGASSIGCHSHRIFAYFQGKGPTRTAQSESARVGHGRQHSSPRRALPSTCASVPPRRRCRPPPLSASDPWWPGHLPRSRESSRSRPHGRAGRRRPGSQNPRAARSGGARVKAPVVSPSATQPTGLGAGFTISLEISRYTRYFGFIGGVRYFFYQPKLIF